ncbi:MAG: hypothetical protein KAJ29_07445 [Alphaproteobacteria bacterium]|nr:hypothetical protein [Alphaproteobacteria bacterium]
MPEQEELEEDFITIEVDGEEGELKGLPEDDDGLDALDALDALDEGVKTKAGGFRAIGIRSPLKYNPKTGTYRFCWNPSNPLDVTQQICKVRCRRGELRRGEYSGQPRMVSSCQKNIRVKYYRFLVKRNPRSASDAACPMLKK